MPTETLVTDFSNKTITTSWRRSTRGWPIKPSLASAIVLAMLAMALMLSYVGWRAVRASMLDSAAESARDAGKLVLEKSNRLLDPVKASLRILSGTSLVGATTLDQRLEHLPMLADLLASSGLMSAVYVGHPDGSFFLVRPLNAPATVALFNGPNEAKYVVQSREFKHDGLTQGEYLFFDAKLALVERRVVPDYQFDPRTRPWYQAGLNSASDSAVASAPYIFFSTKHVGISLSIPSKARQAVLGVDLILDDLASSLKSLRMTEHTELALIDRAGKVLIYPDMSRVLLKKDDGFDFQAVDKLGVASFTNLLAAQAPTGKFVNFASSDQDWLGAKLLFDAWQVDGVYLMVTAPADDFLAELKARAQQMIFWIAGLVLILLPFGWQAGAIIGKNLDRLTGLARRMNRFDFVQGQTAPTLIKEVNTLSDVMGDMGKTIQTFLQISHDMATEPKVERMLDNVLLQVVTATRCAAGAVYLRDDDQPQLRRVAFRGDFFSGSEPHGLSTVEQSPPVVQREVAAILGELQVKLQGRNGKLEGILVLQYRLDAGHADPAFADFVRNLSGMLAVSIETRQLIEAQKKLLDAVIRLMAGAIDAKSPYTGGHCERVPVLAGLMVDRMVSDTEGPYANFTMSDEQRHEFHLGAWLHDCGKVTSPEHVVDKATKLEAIYNRIHEVRTRFEVLWRDAEIAHLKRLLGGDDAAKSQASLEAQEQQLQSDFAFVAQCNVGAEFMSDSAITRLAGVAGQTWVRHFDHSLGLSGDEGRRLAGAGQQAWPAAATERLLSDRAEHVIPWGERKPHVSRDDPQNVHGFDMVPSETQQNMGELHNLSVRRGTLTDEDRFKINDHIVQTLVMLKGLPWPGHLARVPDIAATHHERIDGKGYPRKLGGAQLRVEDRVMALADVFEALTAADRPYKAPKTLTESLKIMALMCKDQHLDADLFRYFLHSRIWLAFAKRYLKPEQIDPVDIGELEKLLPAKSPESPTIEA